MILDFMQDILKTDVTDIFEDVSVLKNINEYSSNWYEKREKFITIHNWKDFNKFNLMNEKLKDINLFLNSFLSEKWKKFKLINNKFKIINNNIYINLYSIKNGHKNEKISLIIDHEYIQFKNNNKDVIGIIDSIKIVKSHNILLLYIFFKEWYLKIKVNDINMYLNYKK